MEVYKDYPIYKERMELSLEKLIKLIPFLYSKLHSWYYKNDKYIDVVNDMYDDIEELDLSKEKDDYER